MKKWVMSSSIILSLLLFYSVTGYAVDGGKCGENLEWLYYSGTLEISGTGALYPYGYLDAPWELYEDSIKTLKFLDGVTEIHHDFFLPELTNITLPNSITRISGDFSTCGKLKEIYIKDISAWCNINFTNQRSNPLCNGGNLYVNDILVNDLIIPETVNKISNYAFNNCDSLNNLTILDGVEIIGENAFSYCTNLNSITMSDSVKIIENFAFSYCESLDNVILNSGLISIGYGSFEYCGKLSNVIIPNSITNIEAYAFQYCKSLSNIRISNNIVSIGQYAFSYCYNLSNVEIEKGISVIEVGVFDCCISLKSITLPDSIVKISNDAFNQCRSLINVYYSGTNDEFDIISIGTGNNYLKKANINCDKVDKGICGNNLIWVLDVNGTLQISGEGEMYSFDKYDTPWWLHRSLIKNVDIQNGVTTIGDNAFRYIDIKKVFIPESITSIGLGAFYECSSLEYIHVDDNNQYYCVDNNKTLFNKDRTILICCVKEGGGSSYSIPNGVIEIMDYAFADCSELSSITIPDTVVSIGNYAFSCCTNLDVVNIPNGVTLLGDYVFASCIELCTVNMSSNIKSIGNYTFYNCTNLNNITIPDNVISIGNYTFSNCSNLNNIIMPNSIRTIGHRTFENCKKLEKVTIPSDIVSLSNALFYRCEKLSSITIPNNVDSIGWGVFYYCKNLHSITISKKVINIGNFAFSDCPNLSNIYYTGNKNDWSKITIGSDNSPLTTANIIYNYKEQLPKPIPATHIYNKPHTYTNDNGIEVTKPSAVTFAKAEEGYADCSLIEYGMLFSKEDMSIENFVIGAPNVLKAKGNAIGYSGRYYGILFYGPGVEYGKTYYTLPYAIYEDSQGDKITVYGQSKTSFTPEEE